MPEGFDVDSRRRNIPALREIIDERKEKAVDRLSESYAKNRLPLEEYERLVEYINKIESERELVVVERIVDEYHGNEEPANPAKPRGKSTKSAKPRGKQAEKTFSAYDDDDDDETEIYHPHAHHHASSNLAVLSSRVYSGPVKSGSQFVSILGSSGLKIRKADLSKRLTVLNVVSILGDNTIYIEPGIRVVNRVIPILGNSGVSHKVSKAAEEDGPELIISGTALLGNIDVKLLKELGS